MLERGKMQQNLELSGEINEKREVEMMNVVVRSICEIRRMDYWLKIANDKA